jgi:hypothetical protein
MTHLQQIIDVVGEAQQYMQVISYDNLRDYIEAEGYDLDHDDTMYILEILAQLSKRRN